MRSSEEGRDEVLQDTFFNIPFSTTKLNFQQTPRQDFATTDKFFDVAGLHVVGIVLTPCHVTPVDGPSQTCFPRENGSLSSGYRQQLSITATAGEDTTTQKNHINCSFKQDSSPCNPRYKESCLMEYVLKNIFRPDEVPFSHAPPLTVNHRY